MRSGHSLPNIKWYCSTQIFESVDQCVHIRRVKVRRQGDFSELEFQPGPDALSVKLARLYLHWVQGTRSNWKKERLELGKCENGADTLMDEKVSFLHCTYM